MSSSDGDSISRRKALAAFSSLPLAGALAGCEGGGDDTTTTTTSTTTSTQTTTNGNGELGERVPSMLMTFWSFYLQHENAAPIMQTNIQDGLGVQVEVRPTNIGQQIGALSNDQRNQTLPIFRWVPNPVRLDPQQLTIFHTAMNAGAGGGLNPMNYASCDYTDPAVQQQSAPNLDTRQDLVNEAHSVLSNDKASIPVVRSQILGAIRTDEVTPNSLGEQGLNTNNEWVFIDSTSGRDTVSLNTDSGDLETRNFPTISVTPAVWMWNHLTHTPLFSYDENFEFTNVYAANYQYSDEGRTLTVELTDGTFHNGDPVTAEDVKFTFEYLTNNADVIPQAPSTAIASINAVDDSTVEFNLEQPNPTFVTTDLTMWGIFHKDTWVSGGAREDPAGFDFRPAIGSGPFQLVDFAAGQFMLLEPHDGSPAGTPDFNLAIRAFDDKQAVFQALQQNQLQLAYQLTPALVQRIEDEMSSVARTTNMTGFTPGTMICPQCNIAPTKFPELRDAIGKVLNRQRVNELAYRGTTSPTTYSELMPDPHPWRPPEDMLHQFTDQTTGDVEAARAVLEDAGWGWDDQGNLHYPPDADLSPQWPAGEAPNSDNGFACLDQDGNWIPPSER